MSTRRVPAQARRAVAGLALVAATRAPLTAAVPASAEDPAPGTVWGWGRNLGGQLGNTFNQVKSNMAAGK